ncbi:MAG: AbiV family abortive infection protein [Planctomycetes bacterium]|nr:AbiV family abortive infection protein [Planctomycetota bacterium]
MLLRFSEAAAANGCSIADDARILAERGRWPRATALMILACEEMGKAKYARLLAIGALKEKLGGKNAPSSMSVLLSRHPQKQMLAHDVDLPYMRELILGAFSGLSAPSNVEADTPAGEQAVRDLLRELKRRVDAMQVDRARLKADFEQLQRTWDDMVTDSRLDTMKQRGLYVDFSEDRAGVVTPSDVGSAEFREAESLFEQARRSTDAMVTTGLTPDVLQAIRDAAAEDE